MEDRIVKITVAGKVKEYEDGLNVTQLIEKENVETPEYVTVSVNDEFIEKADFEKATVETEQYKKQSQLELNKTNRQLLDAENKVNLSQLAFEQSQEAFRIRQNRFTQGLEKTTDLLMAETQMAQKELEHLQAVFEYNFTKQYLQFLTK